MACRKIVCCFGLLLVLCQVQGAPTGVSDDPTYDTEPLLTDAGGDIFAMDEPMLAGGDFLGTGNPTGSEYGSFGEMDTEPTTSHRTPDESGPEASTEATGTVAPGPGSDVNRYSPSPTDLYSTTMQDPVSEDGFNIETSVVVDVETITVDSDSTATVTQGLSEVEIATSTSSPVGDAGEGRRLDTVDDEEGTDDSEDTVDGEETDQDDGTDDDEVSDVGEESDDDEASSDVDLNSMEDSDESSNSTMNTDSESSAGHIDESHESDNITSSSVAAMDTDMYSGDNNASSETDNGFSNDNATTILDWTYGPGGSEFPAWNVNPGEPGSTGNDWGLVIEEGHGREDTSADSDSMSEIQALTDRLDYLDSVVDALQEELLMARVSTQESLESLRGDLEQQSRVVEQLRSFQENAYSNLTQAIAAHLEQINLTVSPPDNVFSHCTQIQTRHSTSLDVPTTLTEWVPSVDQAHLKITGLACSTTTGESSMLETRDMTGEYRGITQYRCSCSGVVEDIQSYSRTCTLHVWACEVE